MVKVKRVLYLLFLSTTLRLNQSTRKADKIPPIRLIKASKESITVPVVSLATWSVSGIALATPKEDKDPTIKLVMFFMANMFLFT